MTMNSNPSDGILGRPALIDAHMHVYPVSTWGHRRTHDHAIGEYGHAAVEYPTQDAGTIAEAVRAADVAGMSHAIVVNLFEPNRWRVDVADQAADVPDRLRQANDAGEYLVALNDSLCTATIAEPSLQPVIAIDASALSPQQLADHVEDFVRERGAAGVKLHPILQRVWPDDRRFRGVWEICAALEVPAIVHSGVAPTGPQFAAPAAFEGLARSFPRLRVVVAHLGGAAWRETISLAKRHEGLWFDCSEIVSWLGAPRAPQPDEFVSAVRAIGVERVIYGSDYPWYAPAQGMRRVRELSGLTRSELELILGGNAANVFKRAIRSRAGALNTVSGGET